MDDVELKFSPYFAILPEFVKITKSGYEITPAHLSINFLVQKNLNPGLLQGEYFFTGHIPWTLSR
jgi:hypothetical protein